MTGIDRLTSASPLAALTGAQGNNARSAASDAIGTLGHRVLSWVSAAGGDAGGAAAWADRAGPAGEFSPDAGVLAQRGDVYGIGEIAGEIAQRFGATPTQEGDLRRSLESFTREAVVQAVGLSGSGERQIEGLRAALDTAEASPAGDGVEGVIDRLDSATGSLSYANHGE